MVTNLAMDRRSDLAIHPYSKKSIGSAESNEWHASKQASASNCRDDREPDVFFTTRREKGGGAGNLRRMMMMMMTKTG